MNHFQVKCPKCSGSRFWKTSDNRFKCKNCRHIFSPKPNPLNLSSEVLNVVVSEFLLGHSTNIILERVNISKYKLLKVLTLLRMLMTKDVPDAFERIVKLNKTQIGFDTIKQPVFGILCREGKVYAEIVPGIEAKDLKPLVKKHIKKESIIYPDSWRRYTGLAFKGYVHRLVDHSKNEYTNSKEYRINTLEGFWGYLKRKLAAKGGVRRERLPLYLGEYIWRYNHRKLTLKEQEKRLLSLVFQYFGPKN